jgi:hypothetical protein
MSSPVHAKRDVFSFSRMQGEQSFPPYGRSGLFLVFGVVRAFAVIMRGMPWSSLPHCAQWATFGSRFS